MSTGTELVAIEVLKAAEVFAPGGVEKLIADVETKARALNGAIDASCEDGRVAAKSLAYTVARSKTALDDLGKVFVADLKKATAGVDADRRTLRDRLDALRDEIRAPVDAWEAAEKERIDNHVAALDTLKSLEQVSTDPTIAELDERIRAVEVYRARDWQEFSERAGHLLTRIPAALAALREAAVRREAERAELDRLRKAEAERREQERLAEETRARERREQEIAEAARRAVQVRAEQDAREAANAAAEEMARAERQRLDAIARAEQAETNAREAANRAEADKQRAIEADRKRVADEQAAAAAAEAEATRAREADAKHRGTINRGVVAALMGAASLTEEQAKAVVKAIATRKVPNCTIQY